MNDFILNTIGGILGYVFYRILFLIIDVIYRKRQKKKLMKVEFKSKPKRTIFFERGRNSIWGFLSL